MLALVPLKGTRTRARCLCPSYGPLLAIDHFALHLLALKLLAERQIRIHLQRLITSSPLPFWIRIHMMRSLQSCFGSEAPITFNKFSYKFGTQSSINYHFFFILNSLSWNENLGKCFRAERWLKKFAHLTPAWSDLVWW